MTKITQIGVTSTKFGRIDKQTALWFDQIAIGSLEKELSEISDPSIIADIEYLASQDYIISYKYEMENRRGNLILSNNTSTEVNMNNEVAQSVEFSAAVFALSMLYATSSKSNPPDSQFLWGLTSLYKFNIGPSIDLFKVAEAASTLLKKTYELAGKIDREMVMQHIYPLLRKASIRTASTQINLFKDYDSIPIIPQMGNESVLFANPKKAEVVRLIIQSLPIPDDLTPWEAILDFRRDEATKIQLARLKRWYRSTIRTLQSEDEFDMNIIEDEYESMLADYKEHMKIHKLKIQNPIFENIILFVLGLPENLIKLKLTEIGKSFFKIRHNNIALMEAELKAPGRELAYIISANKSFN